MTIIDQSKYNTLWLVTPTFIKNTWANDNVDIAEAEIKAMMLSTANLIKHHKPLYFMGNDLNRQFVYTVDMQAWIATTLATACIEAGLQKFAVINPKDFIADLSTEQTVEEADTFILPFALQRFANEEEALQWFEDINS